MHTEGGPRIVRESPSVPPSRMKLSKKGRYAVRALFDIAFYNEGQPTQVKDIAERQSIPPRFLEQIFQDLKRAGIVASKRGPQGGYNLARGSRPHRRRRRRCGRWRARSPSRTTAARRTRARRRDASPMRCSEELSAKIEGCFDDVTIADICGRADELGVAEARSANRQVYVI